MILLGGFVAVVVAVAVRHRNLAVPRVRGFFLVLAAVVLQTIVMNVIPDTVPHGLADAVHLGTYALAAVFLVRNLRVPGIGIIALGGGLNLAAIAANGGVMPARPEALAFAGVVQEAGTYANSAAVAGARLWWFGDIFALPAYVPLANVFSFGDVVLLVGAYLVFARATVAEAEVLGERFQLDPLAQTITVGALIDLVQRRDYLRTGRDRTMLDVFVRAVLADETVAARTVEVVVADDRVVVISETGSTLARFDAALAA